MPAEFIDNVGGPDASEIRPYTGPAIDTAPRLRELAAARDSQPAAKAS
jgi:hypothetical protein